MKHKAFIDFEMNTNGDMTKDELNIIEMAVVVTNNKGEIIRSENIFVEPLDYSNIYAYTTFLTGITNKDMVNAVSFNEMVKHLREMTYDCDFIYCWGDVDKYCLKKSIDYKNINKKENRLLLNKLTDIQKDINKKIKTRAKSSLKDVAKKLNIVDSNYEPCHRAMPDAILLRNVYFNSFIEPYYDI